MDTSSEDFIKSQADAICEFLSSDLAQKHLAGIRGVMNHVADWSDMEIDLSAILNDPEKGKRLTAEVKCLEQTLAEARLQITDSDLERCRERFPGVATRYIESGGLRASSWSKFVMDRGNELHHALIQLAAFRNWFPAEMFVQKIGTVDWELVSEELDAELKWLSGLLANSETRLPVERSEARTEAPNTIGPQSAKTPADDAIDIQGEDGIEIPQEDVWITGGEAERQTLVNRGTIKRAAEAGKIKTNGKNGREIRYHVASVHSWNKTRARQTE